MRRFGWWILAGIVAAWLGWMTFRPNPAVSEGLSPLTESPVTTVIPVHVLIDGIGNVAVFVPLGFSLSMALRDRPVNRRLLLATVLGASLSVTIELIQAQLPSRVPSLDDWLLNTLGTGLGAGLAWGVQRILNRMEVKET
jgi:glycopeptide antibiotics resistance protein